MDLIAIVALENESESESERGRAARQRQRDGLTAKVGRGESSQLSGGKGGEGRQRERERERERDELPLASLSLSPSLSATSSCPSLCRGSRGPPPSTDRLVCPFRLIVKPFGQEPYNAGKEDAKSSKKIKHLRSRKTGIIQVILHLVHILSFAKKRIGNVLDPATPQDINSPLALPILPESRFAPGPTDDAISLQTPGERLERQNIDQTN